MKIKIIWSQINNHGKYHAHVVSIPYDIYNFWIKSLCKAGNISDATKLRREEDIDLIKCKNCLKIIEQNNIKDGLLG
jgi:pentatricopeptide repeat protein